MRLRRFQHPMMSQRGQRCQTHPEASPALGAWAQRGPDPGPALPDPAPSRWRHSPIQTGHCTAICAGVSIIYQAARGGRGGGPGAMPACTGGAAPAIRIAGSKPPRPPSAREAQSGWIIYLLSYRCARRRPGRRRSQLAAAGCGRSNRRIQTPDPRIRHPAAARDGPTRHAARSIDT